MIIPSLTHARPCQARRRLTIGVTIYVGMGGRTIPFQAACIGGAERGRTDLAIGDGLAKHCAAAGGTLIMCPKGARSIAITSVVLPNTTRNLLTVGPVGIEEAAVFAVSYARAAAIDTALR